MNYDIFKRQDYIEAMSNLKRLISKNLVENPENFESDDAKILYRSLGVLSQIIIDLNEELHADK